MARMRDKENRSEGSKILMEGRQKVRGAESMRPSGLHKEELRKHQTRYARPWGREEQREGVESSQQFNDSHRLVQTCYIPGSSHILFIGFIIHIPCKEGIACHSHFIDEQSEA